MVEWFLIFIHAQTDVIDAVRDPLSKWLDRKVREREGGRGREGGREGEVSKVVI